MTPKDRVINAIGHQHSVRVPKGELLVEEAFLDRFYPDITGAPYFEKMNRLASDAGFDLITVSIKREAPEIGLKDLERWSSETPYFIMGLVDGLFWDANDPVPFEEFMLGLGKGKQAVHDLIRFKKTKSRALIRQCIDKGADGIIIGDDLAYDGGPYVSPGDLSQWIFPGLGEMAEMATTTGKAAFLHSCGNLTRIMDLILSTGFNGLQGVSTFAGNDPLDIRRLTLGRMALMGIFEADRLKPEEIAALKRELLPPLSEGGGYILGSAGGLSVHTPIDSFRALYFDDRSTD